MRFILRPVKPGANQRRILGTKDHFVIEAEFTGNDGKFQYQFIKRFATEDDAHDFAERERIDLSPPLETPKPQ